MSQSDQTKPGSGHKDMASVIGQSGPRIKSEPSVGVKGAGEASSSARSLSTMARISPICVGVSKSEDQNVKDDGIPLGTRWPVKSP